jgi:hypothetical protein
VKTNENHIVTMPVLKVANAEEEGAVGATTGARIGALVTGVRVGLVDGAALAPAVLGSFVGFSVSEATGDLVGVPKGDAVGFPVGTAGAGVMRN